MSVEPRCARAGGRRRARAVPAGAARARRHRLSRAFSRHGGDAHPTRRSPAQRRSGARQHGQSTRRAVPGRGARGSRAARTRPRRLGAGTAGRLLRARSRRARAHPASRTGGAHGLGPRSPVDRVQTSGRPSSWCEPAGGGRAPAPRRAAARPVPTGMNRRDLIATPASLLPSALRDLPAFTSLRGADGQWGIPRTCRSPPPVDWSAAGGVRRPPPPCRGTASPSRR